MSADHDGEFVDDRHDTGESDPYGIVPEGFCQRYNTTSIIEALRRAEDDATATNAAEFPRCPNPDCESVRLRKKRGNLDMEHRRETAYKCGSCGNHFDTPKPPKEETMPGSQSTLREGVRDD